MKTINGLKMYYCKKCREWYVMSAFYIIGGERSATCKMCSTEFTKSKPKARDLYTGELILAK